MMAKTISFGDFTVRITSRTRMAKLGKLATLEDAQLGEDVTVAYKAGTDGTLDATIVRFGPKP